MPLDQSPHVKIRPESILQFDQVTAVVVGDLMLDRYIEGGVERISPEAPIPVVRSTHSWAVLGGAANVAATMRAMGASVSVLGTWSNDDAGRELESLLLDAGVSAERIVVDGKARTTEKVRVVARGQQVVRIDHELFAAVPDTEVDGIIAALRKRLAGAEHPVLVLSDYAKGVVTSSVATAVIKYARSEGIPVIVDPKSNDITKYRGATVVKPNAGEVARMVGWTGQADSELLLRESAPGLREAGEIEALVVSMSEQGVGIVRADGVTRLPSHARAVADVSGAGDAMIAAIAISIASGGEIVDAVELGNIAAGIACGRPGTAIVSASDLIDAVLGVSDSGTRPRVSEDVGQIARLVDIERRSGKTIVFANGVFDLLHAGHVRLLQEARSQGDILVVGVNSDASTSRLKGPGRPLQPQGDRLAVLDAVRFVDYVTVFEEDTPLRVILALRPDVIVKGSDYGEEEVVGGKEARAWGGHVHLVDLLKGVSTTRLSSGEQVTRKLPN